MRRLIRINLFVAFAFTVMADPVSSVTYAIQASLAGADGDLADLVPTMTLVIATMLIVTITYHQLIGRFPDGGGGARAVSVAFGRRWMSLPLAALVIDFTLTAAISSAAAAAAVIAYVPELADWRIPIALGIAALVAGLVTLGNLGRMVFALATQAFLALGAVVIVRGFLSDPVAAPALGGGPGEPILSGAAPLAVLLALPLGMALATGIEAPSNAIAQLGQLGERGRRRFGRLTIWLMMGIIGVLTISIAVLAVRLGIGLPEEGSTLLADIARQATGEDGFFPAFQAASAILLVGACASAFLAGSGLLEALAAPDGERRALPGRLAQTNRFFVPFWSVGLVFAVAAAIVLISGADEQTIVKFYAVAVFIGFFTALLAAARLSRRDGDRRGLAVNLVGLVVIAFVLALNLIRVEGLIVLAVTGLLALVLTLRAGPGADPDPGGSLSR